jgi:hypothetical protein
LTPEAGAEPLLQEAFQLLPMIETEGFERDFSADRDGPFASRLAPTGKCIPNVGASLLAKGPVKSAQNAF